MLALVTLRVQASNPRRKAGQGAGRQAQPRSEVDNGTVLSDASVAVRTW